MSRFAAKHWLGLILLGLSSCGAEEAEKSGEEAVAARAREIEATANESVNATLAQIEKDGAEEVPPPSVGTTIQLNQN